MNIFKKTTIFWCFAYLLGAIFMAWSYKITLRSGTLRLCQFYQEELGEFFLIALILPVFAGITLKRITDHMDYSRMLAWGSRKMWLKRLVKMNLRVSLEYITVILLPMSTTAFLFSKELRTLADFIYFVQSFAMYTIVFALVGMVIMVIKIKWNSDITALVAILVTAFLPYVFTKVCMRSQIVTFSDILNSLYLYQSDQYLWMLHELEIVITLTVFVLGYKVVEHWIVEKDFLWRHGGHEI